MISPLGWLYRKPFVLQIFSLSRVVHIGGFDSKIFPHFKIQCCTYHVPISDFATRPTFYSYAYFYGKFLVKKLFSIKEILRIDKKYSRKVLLWLQFAFFREKNIFLQKFWDFWGFLKFRDLVAKSEIGT